MGIHFKCHSRNASDWPVTELQLTFVFRNVFFAQGYFSTLQNKVQLCCTLYQWFLHIVAVGGLCMPTNECSKGGELLAIVQHSNNYPNHHHTRPPFTRQMAFCSTSLGTCLFPRHWPPRPIQHTTAQLCFIL